jgi:hypothetical protein
MRRNQYTSQPLVDLTAEVPGLEPLLPYEGPLTRPVYHGDACSCLSCADIRASVDLYLSAKRLGNINNWWNS